jgi:hypothetical protein
LGYIDLLWSGFTPNVTPTPPLSMDEANPEGRKVTSDLSILAELATVSAFGASVSGW